MAEKNWEKLTEIQLKTQTQKPKTRLEVSRSLLKDLEKRLSRISEISAISALEIPYLFDQANDLLGELRSKGTNISSEMGQFNTLAAQFQKKKADFIHTIGGPQKLVETRQERKPSTEHWGWFVDIGLAEDNKRKTIRLVRSLVAAILLLIIGIFVYRRFFAPDPLVQASYGHQTEAENALTEGDLETALDEVKNALMYTPEQPDLYVLEGIIYEALGQEKNAEASYSSAKGFYEQPEYFYNQRAILFLMLGEPQRAMEDTETALKINPESALAYLYQGQSYEKLGEINKAIQSYEKADDLAQQVDNVQLQAIIRINLSNAYQNISMPTFDSDESELP